MSAHWIIRCQDTHGNEHQASSPMSLDRAQRELQRLQRENPFISYWLEIAPDDRREIKPEQWGRK